MLTRKALVLAAGLVVLGNSITHAADPAQPSQPYTSARPNLLEGAAPAHRRPLMDLLDRAGLAKPLEDAGINIYGHVEAGWTWNFDDPSDKLNPFRIFDFVRNKPILDQLDFTIERAVDYRKDKFDVGFKAEMMYDADACISISHGPLD